MSANENQTIPGITFDGGAGGILPVFIDCSADGTPLEHIPYTSTDLTGLGDREWVALLEENTGPPEARIAAIARRGQLAQAIARRRQMEAGR